MEYTLVVTSLDRHDLLETTLRSFFRFADALPVETIIGEDSPLEAPAFLKELPGKITWLASDTRRGQIYNIDKAYARVRTPFIFHCEDDWQFCRAPFILPSYETLKKHPKIFTVSLYAMSTFGHPLTRDPDYPFPVQVPDWRAEGWGGFNFNPGLRRLKDYQEICGTYGKQVGYNLAGCVHEAKLSKLHLDAGFRIATFVSGLDQAHPYIKHIGHARSRAAKLPAVAEAPPPIETKAPDKILFAVPACWKFEYGKHSLKVGKLDVHDNAFANQQENPYQAVRETWAKDIKTLPNAEFRFFYGRGANRQPLDDEIFLDVDDSYDGLTHKMQAICRWALERNFERLFKCDSDTFVYIDRLMRTDFRSCDQLGWSPHGDGLLPNGDGNYSTGGPGYWLSKRAMEAIAKDTVSHYAEDLWVGSTIRKYGLKRAGDRRFLPGYNDHYAPLASLARDHDFVTLHACTPQMLRELYAARSKDRQDDGEEQTTSEMFPHSSSVLVAVVSCNKTRNLELRRSQRRTWVAQRPEGVDCFHFVGHGDTKGEAGVIQLDCADGYDDLIYKTRAIIKSALEHGYDYLFKTDDDTYVRLDQLLGSGFEQHDYIGWARGRDYCQGGSGYWLSHKAMEAVTRDTEPPQSYGTLWEDQYVGKVLAKAGIFPHHDDRYLVGPRESYRQTRGDFITLHKLMPKSIDEMHAAWGARPELAVAARGMGVEKLPVGARRTGTQASSRESP